MHDSPSNTKDTKWSGQGHTNTQTTERNESSSYNSQPKERKSMELKHDKKVISFGSCVAFQHVRCGLKAHLCDMLDMDTDTEGAFCPYSTGTDKT